MRELPLFCKEGNMPDCNSFTRPQTAAYSSLVHPPWRKFGPCAKHTGRPFRCFVGMAGSTRIWHLCGLRCCGHNETESVRAHFDVRNGGLDFRHVATDAFAAWGAWRMMRVPGKIRAPRPVGR